MSHDPERFDDDIRRAVRSRLQPPSPGFEDRLLAAVRLAAPAPHRRGRVRLATFASIVLAVTVVSALLWTSPGFRARWQEASSRLPVSAGQPVSRPAPAGIPDPRADATFVYQAVSAQKVISTGTGGRTFFATQPAGPLVRVAWTGAARGTATLPVPVGDVVVSPDGRYFFETAAAASGVAAGALSPGARILDDSGSMVANDPTFPALGGVWADDSRHICQLETSPANTPVAIEVSNFVPGRDITHSRVPISGLGGLPSGYLLGCSLQSDRAVLVSSPPTSVDVVQLSTGHVALHQQLSSSAKTPVMSLDGRYLAMNQLAPGRSADATADVLDLGSGRVLAHLAGFAVGFSGDGQLVALNGSFGGGPASVVEWRTGRTVWRDAQGTLAYGDVQTQPGGRAMALEVSRASEPPDVVLVRGNGSFVTIARSAQLLLSVGLGGVG